ncbi:hypothetical protein LCGC14_1677890 [marine sediment metagenome]|uniref:PIN domain-containing protein n=1 Tax=marine sediment metagenome TaxID=412755 RepID=A0A0F9HPJ9_9ZZZZ
MEDTAIIFIDSNYWIYLFDETTAEHIHVKKHFDKIIDQCQIAINIPVMIEVMHYLIKRLGANLAKPKWDLFSSMNFINDDLTFQNLDLVFNELSSFTHTGIGARDASILASMKKLSVQKICTHDKSFKQIPSIEVIDPIP